MRGPVQSIRVVDSHTGGEPTRVVLEGGPLLSGPFTERIAVLQRDHEGFRAAVCNEPRGSEVLVGALLTPPVDPTASAGVIFFNNVGYLGMCGHGTIGLVTTLAWLGRLQPGRHRIETCVGVVTTELDASGRVAVRNVPSYRHAHAVAVEVPGHGRVTGDVAWGGNWFFLCADHGQRLEADNVEVLGEFSWRVRRALEAAGITGAGGGVIDHIELTGPGSRAGIDGRNFVLCPGKAYDRSPCGTGTSAKLACLVADGKLKVGGRWHQESIIGSVFEGSVEIEGTTIVPTIRGEAYITADSRLLLDPADPYRFGIRAAS
jgi:4-hydroxyproline epimerase